MYNKIDVIVAASLGFWNPQFFFPFCFGGVGKGVLQLGSISLTPSLQLNKVYKHVFVKTNKMGKDQRIYYLPLPFQ